MPASAARRRRLAEELLESGLRLPADEAYYEMLIDEIDRALRPNVHERKVPSVGTILEPRSDPATWETGTQLDITRKPLVDASSSVRWYTDGLSSWLLRRSNGDDEWIVFDRPAGSERDLVVLAETLDATIVQRHPTRAVRVVGSFGVLRWEGFTWYREPPVRTWVDTLSACPVHGDPEVLKAMLEFAVHDLGSLGIGALLIYRPEGTPGPVVEQRLAPPPPLRITKATHLAPLRHALAQVDGAAVFDTDGVLRQLGVRLIPSDVAEASVDAFGGTRHTSGRRYSYDDPTATVIAVSEDGPVSVLRKGKVLGRSEPERETAAVPVP